MYQTRRRRRTTLTLASQWRRSGNGSRPRRSDAAPRALSRTAWVVGLSSLFVGCGGGGAPVQVPKTPPQTHAVLVDSDAPPKGAAGEGKKLARVGFPLTKPPLRRDACGVAVAVTLEALMRPEGIELLQRRLVERELLKPDAFQAGELDVPTLSAVGELQSSAELPVVGIPNYATLSELGLEPTELFISGDSSCEGGSQ